MSVSVLEFQRARRVLEEFCTRRNARLPATAGRLMCRQEGDSLLIGETARQKETVDGDHFQALVQLSYQAGSWSLYWPQEGGWRPYPHLPQAGTIQAVVEELEQAPLHVHWE